MNTTSLPGKNTTKNSLSRVVGLWHRLPVLIRSVVGGFFVFIVLQTGCTMLFLANIELSPAVPWMLPAGLLYLWVMFRFFDGQWGFRSTADARRESLRARRLDRKEWAAALGAALPVMIFFISVTMVSYRLVVVPGEELPMPEMPWWSTYSVLLMISIVAGVSEESGFRGYMQAPLEKRYGPAVAIGVASVMFWLGHLNHANGIARVVALVVMGASLGTLAWCARSIFPAIIAHAMADSIIFIGSVSGVGPDYIWTPVPLRESGVDGFFWVTIMVMVLSGFAATVTLRRLAAITGAGRSS